MADCNMFSGLLLACILQVLRLELLKFRIWEFRFIMFFSALLPPDSHSDFDAHLVQSVQGLRDLRKDLSAGKYIYIYIYM